MNEKDLSMVALVSWVYEEKFVFIIMTLGIRSVSSVVKTYWCVVEHYLGDIIFFVIFHPVNKPLKQQITIKIQKTARSQKTHKISWSYNRLNFKLETTNKKHM